jgi:hypothetical protein
MLRCWHQGANAVWIWPIAQHTSHNPQYLNLWPGLGTHVHALLATMSPRCFLPMAWKSWPRISIQRD